MSRIAKTNQLLKVLVFVDEYIQKHGFSPTFRDICQGTQIKSSSHVSKILKQLGDLGYVGYEDNTPRSLKILPQGRVYMRQQSGMPGIQNRGMATYINQAAAIADSKLQRPVEIPVVGNTFASLPTPVPGSEFSMYDYESTLSVAREMLPSGSKAEEIFALEVRGQSMIEAHINEGDYILVQQVNNTASNGEMVVVWLEDENETTLKYFYRRENFVELKPANSTMQPIIIHGERPMRIVGRVVSVVRL